MSQLGRISGQLLKDNLTRQGTDLAFDTDLLYLNVNSRYISINTDITSKPLFVNGEMYSTDFNTTSIDGITSFNLDFVANSIISQNNLNLFASTYVFANNIKTDNISIDNNSIVTLQSNSNLELRPNGTGTVEIQSNTNITGNLTATGSITLDGNIIFGDSDTDNVTFLADINTDIIPDQNKFYNLGTNSKRWNTVYSELVNGEEITSLEMLSGGVNLALRQGNIWYVATNGSNSNVGDHQSGPFATIAKALSEATAGDTVFIYPGTYTEITPLTVPVGVSVRGFDLRSVNIIPDSTTTSENIFLLNGETTVSDLTIKNFYYDSVNDTGYAFSFAPSMTVTSRSPYVQNITVLTQGTTLTVDDPRGFASGDAGRGAKVDGSLATAVSKEASMLFHSVTFITPGVDALVMTNGVRVEWLNSFTYFANRSIYATQGMVPSGSLTFSGSNYLSLSAAQTIGTQAYTFECFFYTASNGLQTLLGASASGGMSVWLFGDGINPVTTIQIDRSYVDAAVYTVSPITVNTWHHIAVTRDSLNNASVFLDGVKATGATTNTANYTGPSGLIGAVAGSAYFFTGYLTQIKLAVGSNYYDPTAASISVPTAVLTTSANTKLLLTAATSGSYITDISGTQTVSNVGGVTYNTSTPFLVRTGAELRSIGSASVYGNYGAVADGPNTLMYLITHNFAYIGAGKDTSNDPSLNIAANETIELGGGRIYYQSLDNKGNFKVGDAFGVSFETGLVAINGVSVSAGGITSINFAAGTDETVIDATQINVNNIKFSGNTLSSLSGNIELDSHTNELNVSSNVYADKNINVDGDFTVDGELTIGNAFIDVVEFVAPVDYGLRAIVDNVHSLGNSTKRWADVVVFDSYIGNLKVSDNVITTLDSNADLELRADGTGRIYVPVDNVEFDQNLTVNGTSYTKNVSLIGSLLQAGNIQRTGDTTTGNYTQIGNQTVNGNGLYDDVLVTGNSITSSSSNANLVLDAAGTGRIYIPFSDVQVINDFVVEGLLDGSIASVTTSTTAQTYSNNNISIGTNIIQTTVSNSDLELRAAGTGRIYIPSDDVEFDQNLTVDNTTNLSGTNITGSLVNIGTITHTGNTGQTGNRYITGDLTVSSNVDFGDIEFINNRLITTRSNSDLEFKTSGSGVVKFISPTRFEQAAIFNNVFTSNITNSNTVTSNIFYNGNIEFYDNNLRTTNSNSDLVLLANNTGTISMPLDPLVLGQDFTVTLSSTLKNTTINGLLQHVGATVQTGNNTQTGNFVLTGDLTVGNDAYFENVNFINNQITTVNSNSNLELRAAGSGAVIINDNLILGQGLTVTGLSSTVTISNSALITSEKFVNNDILIQDNYITTTQSNSNLVLSGELTGGPRLERIKFDNNKISTTTGNENIVIQGTTNNIIFNTISAVKIPTGTDAQRPTLAQADLRFNTTETLFNGYSGAKVTFGGVYSADQRTNLTAHPTNNTLNFVANLIPSATISSTGINLNGLSTDNNLLFNGNTISSQSLNSDIFFTTNGTGQVKIDDLGVRNNQFNNLNTTQPLILQNTGFGYIQFSGTGGLVIPAGNNSQRPLNPEPGDIRWNNEDEQAEVFNGTQYQSFQGDSGTTLTGEEVEDVTNLWALILG